MTTIAHGHGDDHGHDDGHGHGHAAHGDPNSPYHIHPPPLIMYFLVFGALMVLLGITVGLYYVDFNKITGWSWPNIILALFIAIVKASLVVLFFMNVRGSTRLTWLWAALGFIWLLLMGGIFMDYQSRAWIDSSGWQ